MKDPHLEGCLQLALEGVHRAFPYHLSTVLSSPTTLRTPRDLTPVFFGCFDWHSAVHGHWLLAWGRRTVGNPDLATACEHALDTSFTEAGLRTEAAYLAAHPAFERPYGLAWVLTLAAELHRHEDARGRVWATRVQPLAEAAAANLATWLPKLTHPVRCGTHPQTAFALSLALDWARQVENHGMLALIRERAHAFFGDDRDYPLHLEPSGEDFLSPSLSIASLMSRLLDPPSLMHWLDRTMPTLGRSDHLEPVTCLDRRDGRLTHLDGLNLSRAWMLADLEGGLPAHDDRLPALARSRQAHRDAGLAAVAPEDYAGSHWLGTFAAWMMIREMLRDGPEGVAPSSGQL